MNIKVRDLKQTETIENNDKLMVLVDDDLNLVKNITKEEFLTNIISSTENNALVQETDGNLYVNTKEIADSVTELNNRMSNEIDTINTNIGELSDLTTEDKSNLVAAINEASQSGGVGAGTSLPLGAPVYLDSLLSYEEAKGYALAGTYVYKEAVAGSRYGYPTFYEKWVEQYENAENSQVWIANNVTVQGNITHNNGTISNFSSSNYVMTPDLGLSASDNIEIYMKLNTGGDLASNTFVGLGFGMQFWGSKMDLAGVTTIGSYVYSANTDYYIKISYANQTITAYYSTDGVNYIQDGSASYTGSISSSVQFGYGYYNSGLAGALYLDETYIKVNGEIVWEGTTNGLKNPNGRIFYNIEDKSAVDGLYASTGVADMWGIDKENERIFTPRNDWFMQGCNSVDDVNEFNEAGLPNITGTLVGYDITGPEGGDSSGSLYINSGVTNAAGSDIGGNYYSSQVVLDASRSSSVYGNSTTVQPKSSNKLLYYIVGNTEVQGADVEVVDITTSENDTIPLGFSVYSGDVLSPKLGWLKSSGQWSSGEVYSTFYNEAVSRIGQAFAGGNIVEYTEAYTDYDLVINQDNQTFRLPLLDGSETVVPRTDRVPVTALPFVAPSNGLVYISFTGANADNRIYINGNTAVYNQKANSYYGCAFEVPVVRGDEVTISGNMSDARFCPAVGNGSLYFKVANSVQNLELLNAGEVLEAVQRVEALPHITETYKNGSSWYRVHSDGWCEQGGRVNAPSGSAQILTVNLLKTYANTDYAVATSTLSTATTDGFAYWFGSVYGKSTTAIQFRLDNTNYLTSVDWFTCGYLAEGEY